MSSTIETTRDQPTIDISQINEYLYIGAHPRSGAVETVEELGIKLVISMLAIRPTRAFFHHPFKVVMLPSFDHPRLPIPVFVLQRGVNAALPIIEQGGAVLCYCKEGRHRSVAMACCILIARGYTADEAMQLVIDNREIADPHAPHLEKQILRFEQSWLKNQTNSTG